jgi:hypothetical protein
MMPPQKPDPKEAVKRKFLKEVANRIAQETSKERRTRGADDGEMDSSEVFKVYTHSPDSNTDNKLIALLEKKNKKEEEKERLKAIFGESSGGVKPVLIDVSPTPQKDTLDVLRVASIDEIRKLDKNHELLMSYDPKKKSPKGGIYGKH